MSNITIDFNKVSGKIKNMHSVNNGPLAKKNDQTRSNFDDYKAAKIPYARIHDASFCSGYGGPHIVDVNWIFPDFSKDENDPASYDFTLTDWYLQLIMSAGTKVFYRLGAAIEHAIKKYNTIMPADFEKWARICEHIIMHYNEGWADGYKLNIEYWEIWNEPDLDEDDSTNKLNWSGTAKDYHRLYKIAATHLKNRFPDLKIGGPALAFRDGEWLDEFLEAITKDGKKTPMDFFSWHIYTNDVKDVVEMGARIREKLDRAGYTRIESILNEWNYVEGWSEAFISSIEAIISERGAAFTAATMCAMQKSSTDMLMYYDARPCAFNGLFDFYTQRPLKGYYPFVMFADLYEKQNELETTSDDSEIYIAAAKDEKKFAAMVCYYSPDKTGAKEKTVTISANGAGDGAFECYLVDKENTMEKKDDIIISGGKAEIKLEPNSVMFIKKQI